MKRLIKWLLLLSIVVVAALTLILFNPLLIKSPVEALLHSLTGYEISLGGELELSVGKQLSVRATDIHIVNSIYKDQPELAVLGTLQVSLETGSLFSGALVLTQIQLGDAVIALDTNEAGLSNWENSTRAEPQDKPEKEEESVHIKNIQIKNSTLSYQQYQTSKNQHFKVSSFVQTEDKDGLMNIDLDGSFNDRPVTFDGNIGRFENIVKGRDISFAGSGRFGPIKISGKGLIDDLRDPKQPKFEIELLGPDTADVAAMLKIDNLGDGPFYLKAHGQDTNGHYSASVEGNIGHVNLSATAMAQRAGSLDNLTVKLDASGPKLGALARAFGQQGWPDQPFSLHGDIQRNGSDLEIAPLELNIGGANLLLQASLSNFPRIEPSKASLSVEGDDVARFSKLLGLKDVATGPFSLQGNIGLSDKNINQLHVSLKTALGQATVSGSLGAAPTYSDTRLHLNLHGPSAHKLMSIFEIDALPDDAFTLESDFYLADVGLREVQRVTLENIKIEMLDVELTGSAAFDTNEPLDSISSSFQLKGSDIANLKYIPALVKTADLFVPGQPFKLSGNLSRLDKGWDLNDIEGEVGSSTLAVNGVLQPTQKWVGSKLHFNIEGPGLQQLLNNVGSGSYLPDAFSSSGRLRFSADKLELEDFKFKSENAHAILNGSRAWPIEQGGEIQFEVDVAGEDISRFFAGFGGFESAAVAFRVELSGTHRPSRTDFKHLEAKFGNLHLNLYGVFQNKLKEEVSGHIKLRSENISELGRYADKPLPEVALTLEADVRGSLGKFSLSQLQASLGASDLRGTLEVSFEGSKPEIQLHSTSELIDIRAFLAQSEADAQSQTAKSQTSKSKQPKLIPATALPIELLSKFNASIDVDIKQLKLKSQILNNMVLKASIEDGVLNVPVLTMNGQRGTLSTLLTLTPTQAGQADVTLELKTLGLVLDTSDKTESELDEVPALDLIVKVQGQGSNLRQLAASATGSLKAASEGGTLIGLDLSILDSFILDSLFSLILPSAKKNANTKLTCAAVIFELDDGLAKTEPVLAFNTSRITLISKGSLDLNTETLSFGFKATPNKLFKVSATEVLNSFVVVGGTLSKPVVGLDPTKVLLQGGAAVGTLGISLLAKGLLDRFGNNLSVCQNLQEDIKQQTQAATEKNN